MRPLQKSRRAAIALGLAAAGRALLWRPAASEARAGDAELLLRAIRSEHRAAGAYGAALDHGLLEGSALRTVAVLHDQAKEHADGLDRALRGLGARAPSAHRAVLEVSGLSAALGGSQRDFLLFALELELGAVKLYRDTIVRVERPGLLPGMASIMANRGQHAAVLREALGRDPVPDAVETGRLE